MKYYAEKSNLGGRTYTIQFDSKENLNKFLHDNNHSNKISSTTAKKQGYITETEYKQEMALK